MHDQKVFISNLQDKIHTSTSTKNEEMCISMHIQDDTRLDSSVNLFRVSTVNFICMEPSYQLG